MQLLSHSIVEVVNDSTLPVRYTPNDKGIYSHQCGQKEEEPLQIPIMQCVWIEVTCNKTTKVISASAICQKMVFSFKISVSLLLVIVVMSTTNLYFYLQRGSAPFE